MTDLCSTDTTEQRLDNSLLPLPRSTASLPFDPLSLLQFHLRLRIRSRDMFPTILIMLDDRSYILDILNRQRFEEGNEGDEFARGRVVD